MDVKLGTECFHDNHEQKWPRAVSSLLKLANLTEDIYTHVYLSVSFEEQGQDGGSGGGRNCYSGCICTHQGI